MKPYLHILILLFSFFSSRAQSLYFPPIAGNDWDTISPASLGWCTDQIPSLLDFLESNHTKAFILLKDGKIVVEKYFGTFTRDSVWYWASAGKTLTSFMVGIAQQDNFLSITDTTSQYLGQGWTACTSDQENKITIRNQLTMTTGLDDGVPDNYCTLDSCLIYKADAGTRWAYHNAPYTLLDEVIQNATVKNLNAYMNQKLKIPTGITGAFFPSGYNNVFFSKARSMARYALLILNHGNWNGNQIMTDTAYFHQMVNTSQPLNLSYGYLWWLNGKASYRLPTLQLLFPGSLNPHAPDDMIAALGKNGQIINIVPNQHLVYVRMGDAPGAGEVGVAFNDTIWQKLNTIICDVNAISNTTNDINLNIYPNPAHGIFTIDGIEDKSEIIISDVTGAIIFYRADVFGKVEVDCSRYPAGVYFLTVTSGNKRMVRKIVVN